MIREACVETVDQASYAAAVGAEQLELCSNLEEDGLTPNDELIEQVLAHVDIPVKIMIRSRSGDFFYDKTEMEAMAKDIKRLKKYPVSGIVFGALKRSNDQRIMLDMDAIRMICQEAYPLHVTIHKAIDLCTDILSEIPQLKDISNAKFILTSGGKPTATLGTDMMISMDALAKPEINVIGAGKITHHNLQQIHDILGLRYYHGKKIV